MHMKSLILFCLISCLPASIIAQDSKTLDPQKQERTIIAEVETKDGKKVILMSDGTWTFSPTDKIVPTPSPSPSPTISGVAKSLGPPITATPEQVAPFPVDYNGKLLRFSSTRISDLESYSEDGLSMFLLDVRSRDGKYFSNSLRPGDLKFIMTEDFARRLQTEYRSSGRQEHSELTANLIVELKVQNEAGQRWILARIDCIELLNFSGKAVRVVGNCY